MPSRRAEIVACACGCLLAAAVQATQTPASAPASALAPASAPTLPVASLAQVRAAKEALSKDPELPGAKLERKLRLKQNDEADPAKPTPSWLRGLGRWLSETARALLWVVGAIAVAVLIVAVRRFIKVRGEAAPARALVLPSHVRDLDIRPESLPADIGATARELWLGGQQRAALSLLYRGALSRLVHTRAVPIQAASTEGDCVRLARRSAPREVADFFARLVHDWQFAVYGARAPHTDDVLALCARFDEHLPASVAAPGASA